MSDVSLTPFAYVAQTFEGAPMTGTIDAADLDDASKRLSNLRLRVIRLDPAPRPPRAKPLSGDDFAAFNQQLAHLSAAGLPVEQGLRLIAEDLRDGALAQSIRNVSTELEKGVPLGEAFKRHEKQFPSLYGMLIDAGVRTGNLPGVLLNLGRHLELVSKLRATLWRAVSYPLAVFAGLLFVFFFLAGYILPKFEQTFREFQTNLPGITQAAFVLARAMPVIMVTVLAIAVGIPLLWALLRATHMDRAAADLALPLPMVGPVLRRNLIARWADALKLAVQAGIDLPAGLTLAADIVASPALHRDTQKVIAQLSAGEALDAMPSHLHVLPKTTLAVLQTSSERNDLPAALETLSIMYHQQAELRLNSIAAVLTPLLLIGVAILIAFVVLALFAPLISLIQTVSSPGKK
jgi:type II secretory pathway component PulF